VALKLQHGFGGKPQLSGFSIAEFPLCGNGISIEYKPTKEEKEGTPKSFEAPPKKNPLWGVSSMTQICGKP